MNRFYDMDESMEFFLRMFEVPELPTQSEPPYTEFLIGAIKYDRLGIMSGHVTHGKTYDIIGYDGILYKIINDKGNTETYHHSWFTPVKLYDEDETRLTCRDIDFNVEDYIDLRKHTPDQIRHIAKFYPVYELEEVLAEGVDWRYLVFDGDEFDTHVEMGDYVYDGEEYTYDDIFYLEE
jgi:hypothetical protein